jgi:hypothetical protein
MDPQATWEQLLAAYASGDWDRIEERAQELLAWLGRGGFPPQILSRPDLGVDFDRFLARAGCQFVLETVRGEWGLESSATRRTE